MKRDFVARQFILLTKKLRADFRKTRENLHNDLSRLSNDLQNLKNTVAKHWDTDQERNHINHRVTVSDLQTQIPIRVQTEAKRSKIENFWRCLKGATELVGIAAVIAYTVISWENLGEQIDATNLNSRQAELSRKVANQTAKQFRIDQRPYIVADGAPSFVRFPIVASTQIEANLTIKNIGRTPAVNIVWNTELLKFYGMPKTQPVAGAMKVRKFMTEVFNALHTLDAFARNHMSPSDLRDFGGHDLAPQQAMFNTTNDPVSLSDKETGGLQTSDYPILYFVGMATYTDAFNATYETDFCWASFGNNPNIWHFCDNHNTIK
jgi:hypothetical protein